MTRILTVVALALSLVLLGCLGDTPAPQAPTPSASLAAAPAVSSVPSTPASVPAVDGRPEPSKSAGLTRAQVAAHAQADDCWVIVGGSAYDVTGFLSVHPGGAEPILALCGTDVTGVFEPASAQFKENHEGKDSALAPYRVADVAG